MDCYYNPFWLADPAHTTNQQSARVSQRSREPRIFEWPGMRTRTRTVVTRGWPIPHNQSAASTAQPHDCITAITAQSDHSHDTEYYSQPMRTTDLADQPFLFLGTGFVFFVSVVLDCQYFACVIHADNDLFGGCLFVVFAYYIHLQGAFWFEFHFCTSLSNFDFLGRDLCCFVFVVFYW